MQIKMKKWKEKLGRKVVQDKVRPSENRDDGNLPSLIVLKHSDNQEEYAILLIHLRQSNPPLMKMKDMDCVLKIDMNGNVYKFARLSLLVGSSDARG